MRSTHCKSIVITIGPPEERPWWWQQIEGLALQRSLTCERVSIGTLRQAQMGLGHSLQIARRLWRILRTASRERADFIFTFEADVSCYLIGLLQRLPMLRGPRHVILQFITRERDASLASRCKSAVSRFLLRSVHRVVCSSRMEADYYRQIFGWPGAKVLFVPFHTDERLLQLAGGDGGGEYIIAAGRSYRDYQTLARAVAGTGIRTLIVSGSNGPGLAHTPAEIELLTDIPFDALMERMRAARAVILPLQDRKISIGQSVLLQAMALGQPVIATRTAGTIDYIENGRDGLLVDPGDANALRQAIVTLWNDAGLRESLGAGARARIVGGHLPRHYAQRVADELAVSTTSIS